MVTREKITKNKIKNNYEEETSQTTVKPLYASREEVERNRCVCGGGGGDGEREMIVVSQWSENKELILCLLLLKINM